MAPRAGTLPGALPSTSSRSNAWLAQGAHHVAARIHRVAGQLRRLKPSTKYRSLLVGLCFFATLSSYVERVGFSIALTQLADAAGLDQSAKGRALSSFFWGYVLSQLPGAAVAQRYGGARVLRVSFALWATAALVAPRDPRREGALAASRVIVGAAQGLVIPSVHNVLAERVPARLRAKCTSLATSGMYLGSASAMVALPLVARALGPSAIPTVSASLGGAWLLAWIAFEIAWKGWGGLGVAASGGSVSLLDPRPLSRNSSAHRLASLTRLGSFAKLHRAAAGLGARRSSETHLGNGRLHPGVKSVDEAQRQRQRHDVGAPHAGTESAWEHGHGHEHAHAHAHAREHPERGAALACTQGAHAVGGAFSVAVQGGGGSSASLSSLHGTSSHALDALHATTPSASLGAAHAPSPLAPAGRGRTASASTQTLFGARGPSAASLSPSPGPSSPLAGSGRGMGFRSESLSPAGRGAAALGGGGGGGGDGVSPSNALSSSPPLGSSSCASASNASPPPSRLRPLSASLSIVGRTGSLTSLAPGVGGGGGLARAGASSSPASGVPWGALATHPAIWAISINNFSFHYALYVVMNWLPTLFRSRLGVELASLGSAARAVPFFATFVSANVGGWASDALIERGRFRVVSARRAVNTVGFVAAALALAALPAVSTPSQGVACSTLVLGAVGFARGGFSVNHMDVCPKYASVVMGISNTAGTVAGILGVWATGKLLDLGGGAEQQAGWKHAAGLAVAACLAATGVFLKWARGDKILPDQLHLGN